MPTTLASQARQARLLIKESPALGKLALPSAWLSEPISETFTLIEKVNEACAVNRRVIVILHEKDFASTLQALKRETRGGVGLLCLIVVAKDADRFLLENSHNPELSDVVLEEELNRLIPLALLRTVRSSHRQEEAGLGSRVGQKTLEKLNEVSIALSAERNPQRLLATILIKGMELTSAEGGTLYMVQEKDGELIFKMKLANDRSNDTSNEVTFEHLSLRAVENSLCGYAALTGKVLNIREVAALKPLMLPQFQKSVDHSHPDGTVSLLTLPMKNSRNEVVAILQLANKRTEFGGAKALPFEPEDESLLASFSTQAAICLENVDLYADIKRLFDGFVKASIAAIESRDPSTGGHSERVAKTCVGLARATTECQVGIYRSVRFREEEIRELEYAALLHDFGKIGVREEVLVKAKKLYPYQLEAIRERIKICKASAKIQYLEKRLLIGSGSGAQENEREFAERLKQLDTYWDILVQANEPSVLKKENREILERIRVEQLLLPDSSSIALVSEEEFQALSVSQGSLTPSERLEIESHVRHTYQFLKMIPWTKDFRHLTEIAYCHHEKLDGTGYPRGLTSHEIPLQSKIMTIADIYDALTASDRWYKEAVPIEKALSILRDEANQGKIDPVLVELFVEKRIYELTQPKALNQVA